MTTIDLSNVCRQFGERAEKLDKTLAALLQWKREFEPLPAFDLGLEARRIDDLVVRLDRFRRTDCVPRYRVAVAGGYGSGKSELINALLREPVLPVEIDECTFVPTTIRAAPGNVRRNVARYMSEAEVGEVLAGYRERARRGDWPVNAGAAAQLHDAAARELVQGMKLDPREAEDLQNLLGALRLPEIRRLVQREALPQDIPDSRLKSLVVRRGNDPARYVAASVTVELPGFALGPDVELVDLPGTDAGDRWAKEITLRHVRDVDVMVLVVDALTTWNDACADLYAAIRDWKAGQAERVFHVINKTDLYSGYEAADILASHADMANGVARFVGNPPSRLFYTSAAAALEQSKMHPEALDGLRRVPATGRADVDQCLLAVRECGGIPRLQRSLREFLNTQAAKVKLHTARSRFREIRREVAGPLDPARDRAAELVAAGQSVRAFREKLEGVERDIAAACGLMRGAAERAHAAARDARRLEGLREGLKNSAQGLLKGLVSGLPAEAARTWHRANVEFRPEALNQVRRLIPDDLSDDSRNPLAGLLRQLAELHALAGDGTIGASPPADPRPSIDRCLQLRIAEVLWEFDADGLPLRPYPLPSNYDAQDANYHARFVADLSRYFDHRIRDLVDVMAGGFVRLCVEWHLQQLGREVADFVRAALAANLPQRCPEAVKTWSDDAQSRRLSEAMRRLIAIGQQFDETADEISDGPSGGPA